jgi:antitoxin ParD1/3/4
MTITLRLTPEQEGWLQARVASGDVASIEDAARRAIDERIAEERKKDRREVLRAGDLSDADIAAIAAARMDPRHAHLDDELK